MVLDGLFEFIDLLKKLFSRKKVTVKAKTSKEIATENGEPYVNVLGMDVDLKNLHAGSFELDWNDKFVSNLIRAGYQGKTDADIVDQWFQTVCRNVVLETYEQEQAMHTDGPVHRRDVGNGRQEVS